MKKSIPIFESYIWQCNICLSNNFIVLLFLLASSKHLILLKQVIGVTHIQGWCLFKNLIEKCCANSRAVLVWGFLVFWKPNQFVKEKWKNIYKLLIWVWCQGSQIITNGPGTEKNLQLKNKKHFSSCCTRYPGSPWKQIIQALRPHLTVFAVVKKCHVGENSEIPKQQLKK